jgi:hypothetical protein
MDKLPHFPIMFCFNSLGIGSLPMLAVPNLVLAPAVIRAFRDYCSATGLLLDHIDEARLGVEGEAWVELASVLRMGRS